MNPTAIRDLMLRDPEFRTILRKRGGKQDRPTEAQLRDALRAWAEHGGEGLGARLSLPSDEMARERVRTALRRGMRVKLGVASGPAARQDGRTDAIDGHAERHSQPAEFRAPGGVQAPSPAKQGARGDLGECGESRGADAPNRKQVVEGFPGAPSHGR